MIRKLLLGALLLLATDVSLYAQATASPRVLTGNWDSKNDPEGMGDNRIFGTGGTGRRIGLRGTGFSPLGILPVSGAAGGVGGFPDGAERAFLSSPTGGMNGLADQLYLYDPLGNDLSLLGTVVGPDGPLSMDGLAFVRQSQQLYAWSNDSVEGTGQLYVIDPMSLTASPLFASPVVSDVEGLDSDAETGVIYALDDLTRSIFTVEPEGGLSFLAAYPGGTTDLDGLAAGGGFLYLFGDSPGDSFFVYDVDEGSYVRDQQGQIIAFPLPFDVPGTTSGAAYVIVPEPSTLWLTPFLLVAMQRRKSLLPRKC